LHRPERPEAKASDREEDRIMTVVDCERTAEVLAVGRAGTLNEAAAEHAAACAACGAALATERALAQLAMTLERQASPPDAAQILFRAQLRQAAAAAERATRPMQLWSRFVGTACVLGAGALAVTCGNAFWHLLTSPAPGASPLLAIAAGASLGFTCLLLYLHSSWNET
jgi:hypothetical protein